MKTDSLEQRQKKWAALPEDLRTLLSAEETAAIIEKISIKHGLADMEQGFLFHLAGKLLNGSLPPTAFIREIEENIDVSREKAAYIAQDINRDIFNGVKDLLKQLYDVGTKPPQTADTTPVPAERPANQPVRSDWGWHGTKNETTGQIEFKRESLPSDLSAILPRGSVQTKPVTPAAPPTASTPVQTNNAYTHSSTLQKSAAYPEENKAGTPHVGSIFEQKLGGTFNLKSETAHYMGTAPSAPSGETKNVPPMPPRSALRIPMKPHEVKTPPIQILQPPK